MFLGSGHLLADQTLYASVRKLPGGHALLVDDDGVRVREYWRFAPGAGDESLSKAELADELGEVVGGAVARHLGDPAKTMIFLSGGADSRAILGAAIECVDGDGSRLHTVSWGASPDVPDSDPQIASLIAGAHNIHHRFLLRSTRDYAAKFRETNSLLDAMTDMAAFHPQEFNLIEGLRNAGFERVLRGDETFGWKDLAYDMEGAISRVGIRRHFEVIDLLPRVMRHDPYRMCAIALEESVTGLIDTCRGMEPNDAKDYLYFNHRLQRYLGSTAYFKQVVLDHRNPLLDPTILDFIPRIPRNLRLEKTLFMECIRRRYPNLCRFPFARHSALEDWAAELAQDSPVREYVASEIADSTSGIWDYFDKNGLYELLNATRLSDKIALKGPGEARKLLNKGIRGALSIAAPRTAERIVVKRRQQSLYGYRVLLRFIVLKHWYDTLAR
jgi:asparagine synthetase B (glutamine-hydrolysing)